MKHATPIPCPSCGKVCDGQQYTGPGDPEPQDGDVAICLYCTAFTTFTDGATKQRLLTADEIGDLPDGIRIQLQRARRFIKESRADA